MTEETVLDTQEGSAAPADAKKEKKPTIAQLKKSIESYKTSIERIQQKLKDAEKALAKAEYEAKQAKISKMMDRMLKEPELFEKLSKYYDEQKK